MTTIYEIEKRIKALDHVKAVEYWKDDGYHVELEDGWQYGGAHHFIEKTYREVIETLKHVAPCHCEDCTSR